MSCTQPAGAPDRAARLYKEGRSSHQGVEECAEWVEQGVRMASLSQAGFEPLLPPLDAMHS